MIDGVVTDTVVTDTAVTNTLKTESVLLQEVGRSSPIIAVAVQPQKFALSQNHKPTMLGFDHVGI